MAKNLRKIRDVGKEIQNGTNAKPERARDLERANWIFNVVHDIINIGPSGIGIDNFKGGCSILSSIKKLDISA
jgi:hypothetical protein